MDADNSDEDMVNMYSKYGSSLTASTVKVKIEKPAGPRLNASLHQSPKSSPVGVSPANATPSEKYGVRGKKGDVIFRYKCKDSSTWENNNGRMSNACKITALEPTSTLANDKYKFMFQKVKNMAESMDYVVETVGMEILDKVEKEENALRADSSASGRESYFDANNRPSLSEMSVDEQKYIGRIRSDGSKLTPGNVYFEGCLEHSNGHVVPLDLTSLEEYHVFPGQIAVMEGKTEMGKCLRVGRMITPDPLPLQKIPIGKIKGSLINIIFAVGPFNPSDSLSYEPLQDLIELIVKDEPDLVILLGPFLDASHKLIEELNVTFEEFLKVQLDNFRKEISSTATKVVLVSSYKDVHSQVVYPTPAFRVKNIHNSEKFMMLPDPATISINGIVIGLTSTDILMHLSKNELANSTISGDRMGRLARHMLTQGSYYPLYPSEEGVPFDVEHYVKYGRMSSRPHILVLPSDLRHFIRDVDGTIVLNPERLTKGCSGGTFARIQIDMSSSEFERGQDFVSIADFCVGEIVKI